MLTHFEIPDDSKELFFKLSSSLQITSFYGSSKTNKFAGLYAIYKDGKCHYVGQSKNLASRLSQHLHGAYKGCDRVYVIFACSNGFSDIYTRNQESVKRILENNEKVLIKKLNPIENLLLPECGFELDKEKSFECFRHELDDGFFDIYSDAVIYKNKYYISVSNSTHLENLETEALKNHNEFVLSIYEALGDKAFERGLI